MFLNLPICIEQRLCECVFLKHFGLFFIKRVCKYIAEYRVKCLIVSKRSRKPFLCSIQCGSHRFRNIVSVVIIISMVSKHMRLCCHYISGFETYMFVLLLCQWFRHMYVLYKHCFNCFKTFVFVFSSMSVVSERMRSCFDPVHCHWSDEYYLRN